MQISVFKQPQALRLNDVLIKDYTDSAVSGYTDIEHDADCSEVRFTGYKDNEL